jgi:hypothetical protein
MFYTMKCFTMSCLARMEKCAAEANGGLLLLLAILIVLTFMFVATICLFSCCYLDCFNFMLFLILQIICRPFFSQIPAGGMGVNTTVSLRLNLERRLLFLGLNGCVVVLFVVCCLLFVAYLLVLCQ